LRGNDSLTPSSFFIIKEHQELGTIKGNVKWGMGIAELLLS
jgi:hypothetical protein